MREEQVAAEEAIEADEATAAFVRERALAAVVTNLVPTPFVLLPFVLLIAALMREDLSATRLSWWLMLTVVSTVISLIGLYRYYMRSAPRGVTKVTKWTIGVGFCTGGLVFGMCPWVAGEENVEVVLAFTVFPSVAATIGCIVAAGRRDLYIAFLTPLVAVSSTTLLMADSALLRALGVLSIFFGFSLLLLHHAVSRNALDAIRLQWRSQRLLRDLAHERSELTGVNDQLASINKRLAHQATHDPLTGLYNRRGTLEVLDQLLAGADASRPVGLLFCDLDRFKAVNDALGHRGGDRFISIIADRLLRSLDAGSIAGRMGGDEFVVVMPGHDMEGAAAIASRLVGVLAQPVHAEGRDMPSSVSIGVACAPEHGTAASELLRHANAALYRAKSSGRNRVELFDGSMQQALVDRLEGEQALRRAIDDDEIIAFFQPEIDASNGDVIGAELLARWVPRTGRVIPANEFMSVAMSAGLLNRITEKVIGSARPHIRRLAMLGLPPGFRFRVNIAPEATEHTWRDDPLHEIVKGIDPSLVTVDVSEAAVDSDTGVAAATLAAFRASGGRVCLDDFARGVSSLSLLRRLPLDEVRIDRLSIDTITAHPHDRAIVRSIIALVREIGLAVTADGVETGAQADALIALGCVRQQGHLYSQALPAGEFEDFLLARLAERYALADQQPTWETNDLT
ncbi:MAG: EAL domain-containing protein [Ilumatobacteraceae bacterium]